MHPFDGSYSRRRLLAARSADTLDAATAIGNAATTDVASRVDARARACARARARVCVGAGSELVWQSVDTSDASLVAAIDRHALGRRLGRSPGGTPSDGWR